MGVTRTYCWSKLTVSVEKPHIQKERVGLPAVGTWTTCEIAESPSGSEPGVTVPSSTALAPLCGRSVETTGGGNSWSIDQPWSPLSNPPLVIPSLPEHD